MCLIRYSETFIDDLEDLSEGLPNLEQRLSETLYRRLAEDPWAGTENQTTGLWTMRGWPIPDLLLVQIKYRVDDPQRIVELIGLRAVNTSIL